MDILQLVIGFHTFEVWQMFSNTYLSHYHWKYTHIVSIGVFATAIAADIRLPFSLQHQAQDSRRCPSIALRSPPGTGTLVSIEKKLIAAPRPQKCLSAFVKVRSAEVYQAKRSDVSSRWKKHPQTSSLKYATPPNP